MLSPRLPKEQINSSLRVISLSLIDIIKSINYIGTESVNSYLNDPSVISFRTALTAFTNIESFKTITKFSKNQSKQDHNYFTISEFLKSLVKSESIPDNYALRIIGFNGFGGIHCYIVKNGQIEFDPLISWNEGLTHPKLICWEVNVTHLYNLGLTLEFSHSVQLISASVLSSIRKGRSFWDNF